MQKNNYPKLLTILSVVLALASCDNNNEFVTEVNNQKLSITTSAISLNNQGVGEMGAFDYSRATNTFEKLVAQNPDWILAQQNLAIALLNRQKTGDEDRAMSIAEELSKTDNSNLVAHYIVGILKFNQGLCGQALPRFETITKTDTTDAYALYFAGQCYLQHGEVESALALYQDAIKADNYLRSAYYGSFMAAQRLEKTDLAKEMLNAYQKLGSNPKAKLAEIKYTRMGEKATALAQLSDNISYPKQNFKVVAPFFAAPKPLILPDVDNIQKFGLVNMHQTQNTQLYIVADNQLSIYTDFTDKAAKLVLDRERVFYCGKAGFCQNSSLFSSNSQLFSSNNEKFCSKPDFPSLRILSRSSTKLANFTLELNNGPHQLAWGDINNDNKIDVYITGKNDQLYLQTDNGFDKVDMQSFGLTQLSSTAVRLVDADHDGDLDILLLSTIGGFEIWNNNLNNTFTPLSTKTNLTTATGYKGIFVQDIDSDRDVDIILQGENHITTLLNDRMWNYEVLTTNKYAAKIITLAFADNNINGMPDLTILFTDKHISTFEFDTVLKNYKNINKVQNITNIAMLQADITGNGQSEILASVADGIKVFNSDGQLLEQILLDDIQTVKILNTITGPQLLILQNQQLFHVASSNNRNPFILFNLSGLEDNANSVRSNYSGIGTSFTIRNQDFYVVGDSFYNDSGVQQDYQAISMAAGNKSNIDYIALEWSDGVYQTEQGLASGQYYKITETQRQLSSCPVIFVWNNGKYEFISDVLGVGGMGFVIGRDEYAVPRPWENYLLNSSQISSDNGMFKLQFTEPMEESAYLDELQIQVLDVPKQWSVVLDERMMISAPQVTGEPLFYQSIINPV
ncbi:hypothetical protein MNBD_GAMMA01-2272, partial [hydrothermal vent metagenome]